MFHLTFRLGPLARAKLVEFWLFRIASRIFLDQIQLCCQNVKRAASGIADFHIVFCHFVDLDLFDTLINTETMIFMDYIISDF